MDSEELKHHELIGLELRVIESPDHNLIGRKGKVIDETKRLLVLKNRKKFIIPKKDCEFKFYPSGYEYEGISLEGSEIIGRPHERLK